ncbi:hypothetical protein HMPREF9420_2002 [Segatella salivae DSM 15606]|uniref:Uncharacterized protein n=1 Tax=Segatella salivae DSM 15606 TaxID=888832 RepID=E6MR84_9BACT|nr:hypothetical protein HMPREF9420_2002 [Segatella salivae DSM 15606]
MAMKHLTDLKNMTLQPHLCYRLYPISFPTNAIPLITLYDL